MQKKTRECQVYALLGDRWRYLAWLVLFEGNISHIVLGSWTWQENQDLFHIKLGWGIGCKNIVQINIVVVAFCHCTVCRFELCTIVVCTSCFMSTYVYLVTMLPIVADCFGNWYCIGTNGSKQRLRHKYYLKRSIPYFRSFLWISPKCKSPMQM